MSTDVRYLMDGRVVLGRLVASTWVEILVEADKWTKGMGDPFVAASTMTSGRLLIEDFRMNDMPVPKDPVKCNFIEADGSVSECWSEDIFSTIDIGEL